MSCFIVRDELLNETINFLDKHIKGDMYSHPFTMYFCNGVISSTDGFKSDYLETFKKEIEVQNVLSWNTRYPHDRAEVFHQKLKLDYRVISIAQFLKNIDCIDYQCCEPDKYYESEFYENLMKVRRWASCLIDGYEQAKWG